MTFKSLLCSFVIMLASVALLAKEPVLPTITVIKPNGGEVWTAKTKEQVQWITSELANSIDIQITFNDGLEWIPLALQVIDIGVYTWKIPNISSTQCRVRVTGYFTVKNTEVAISDESDLVFEIKGVTELLWWMELK